MLNKSICKKCYRNLGWKWDRHDDSTWKKIHSVFCNTTETYGCYHSTVLSPPDHCPYVLEHLIVEQSHAE
jgi:hypothetical protein